MPYSLNSITDDCYEGTTCLVNKFGIKDEDKLSNVEAQITFAKAVMLEDAPLVGNFDFEHFKNIHYFLFCDLYNWAGQIRTVNISKKNTNFVNFNSIEKIASRAFSKVKNGYFDNLNFNDFAEKIADFYNDVNHLHPFREGNGRAQRIYFTQLIRHYGYDINFSDIDTDELMIATIKASQGVMDYLIDFFKKAIIQK